ncbi:MAG: YggT family protein [Candidatus Omnitrophota bacterium]|nr:YggT family protein [Candidatus Omnitrophota bacterium]
MFILGNFLYSVAHLLEALITILYWLIIVRALISWVNPDPFNPIVQFLYKTTDPILAPIRKFMPRLGPVDLSPIIAFFALYFLKLFLVSSLVGLATRLRF